MKKILVIVVTAVLLASTQAAAYEWALDPVHTGFLFEVKHIYSTVRGQFMDFSGDVFFNPANLNKSRFNFEVKVDSINTNQEFRDVHLRSGDFLETGKFPLMTYKSSRISHAGGNRYTVEGELTIKDVTKKIPLEFVYWGERENPLQKKKMVTGLDARLTINRFDYHVGSGKFYEMGVVGKDVDILITLEMLRDQ